MRYQQVPEMLVGRVKFGNSECVWKKWEVLMPELEKRNAYRALIQLATQMQRPRIARGLEREEREPGLGANPAQRRGHDQANPCGL